MSPVSDEHFRSCELSAREAWEREHERAEKAEAAARDFAKALKCYKDIEYVPWAAAALAKHPGWEDDE